jgi:phosphate transport system substrate-binding protein
MRYSHRLTAVALTVVAGTAVAAQTIQINGAGATFPAPIYSKWFSEYNKLRGNVRINYQPQGSGAGIRLLTNKTVFFGATDGPMSEEQLETAGEKVLHVPTVLGAVVPMYNVPGVTGELKFSGPVLADIFLGRITRWNDPQLQKLNAGVNLPNSAITVVHRSDGRARPSSGRTTWRRSLPSSRARSASTRR